MTGTLSTQAPQLGPNGGSGSQLFDPNKVNSMTSSDGAPSFNLTNSGTSGAITSGTGTSGTGISGTGTSGAGNFDANAVNQNNFNFFNPGAFTGRRSVRQMDTAPVMEKRCSWIKKKSV
ncbi:hypothetical protein CHS0354_015536 [Potamilus streckersoni]|uniref:Uncharacterized protein n=1 Tax=Potamilus streckersoni TaxID=2493646 RepID=A0AAE0T604_9BIVA|nr:hypothetical protein CHS0354_015536 [Potamilus streckersoni]